MEFKASYHFKNYHYSTETKKSYMTCIYCNKVLINYNNTTGKVQHLIACRPENSLPIL